MYEYPNTKKIEISNSNINLTNLADSLEVNYKILKQYNPWLRNNKLTNKSSKTYTITIPVKDEVYIFKN